MPDQQYYNEIRQIFESEARGEAVYFQSQRRQDGPVKSVDLLSKENARAHHTNMYNQVNQRPESAIFRRGQPFKVVIHFKEAFKLSNGNLQISLSTGPRSATHQGSNVTLQVPGTSGNWNANLGNQTDQQLTVELKIAPDCPIGVWRMSVGSGDKVFDVQKHFYIIFNPWCPEDAVYMKNESFINEYVMNQQGRLYNGRHPNLFYSWHFHQFSHVTLPAALCFIEKVEHEYRMAFGRSNPVDVSRGITYSGPNCGNGVLHGEWDAKKYGNETKPWEWTNSQDILNKFMQTNQRPVKFGQCWVFAAITCTLCRTLGIPCRVVTNFGSAHDAHKDLQIDEFYEMDWFLQFVKKPSADSIWNFHVWDDAWMARPDLPEGYGGWQAIDACPQERSEHAPQNLYICGPASVVAVKNGIVNQPYETKFVFSEVNAQYNKIMTNHFQKTVQVYLSHVGQALWTKGIGFGYTGPEDLTSLYKFPDGSPEDRQIIEKAASICSPPVVLRTPGPGVRTMSAENPSEDVVFEIIPYKNVLIGMPVVIALTVENSGEEKRTVNISIMANSVEYNGAVVQQLNISDKNDAADHIYKKTVELFPGQREIVVDNLSVTSDIYLNHLSGSGHIRIVAAGTVKETEQVWLYDDYVIIEKPKLILEIPEELIVGTASILRVKLSNPLPKELKNCVFSVHFSNGAGTSQVQFRDVKPMEEVVHEMEVTPTQSGSGMILATFFSDILTNARGDKSVHCQ